MMKYKDIINEIAKQENCSAKEIERQMKRALEKANIHCSVQEFITRTTEAVKDRRYIKR